MNLTSSNGISAGAVGKSAAFTAETDSVQRLDVWLAARLPELSRARIQVLICAGHITVDGRPAKEHRRLKAGQCVRVNIPAPALAPARPLPESIPLDIVYQDADIIVINKPPGMVVHPATGHFGGTLVNALLYYCPDLTDLGDALRPGIIHRLDRDTSGLIVAAKHDAAMRGLAHQFKEHQVHKEYLALVCGRPPARGTVDAAIVRHKTQRKKMTLSATGRAALTTFTRLAVYPHAALLRLRIHTGRTHQIRVHMKHLGHPVLGDQIYGGNHNADLPTPPARQMLHAARLKFTHPATGQPLDCKTYLPADMRQVIAELRGRRAP